MDEFFLANAATREAAAVAKAATESTPALPTLKEYYSRRFEKRLRLKVRPSTLEIYENAFENHLFPALLPVNPYSEDSPLRPLGEFRLDELKRSHMTALVESLMNKKMSRVLNLIEENADGTTTKTKKPVEFKLSRPSLRIILSALTTCLTNAQREDGLIPTNPALALGQFTVNAKNRHEGIDPLTLEEVPVFLQALRQVAPGFVPMFTVLIHCGLRSGEAAGLTWGDVDFKNRYLYIRQTWTPAGRLEKPKNGKERKVDLSDAAIASLEAHRVKLQKGYLKEGEAMPDWVFPNSDGKPFNMTNVRNRVFHVVLKKAGLHRRPLHSTRHTFATLLLNQGEFPVYVKEQMGHSSIKVTVDTYGKWIRTDDRRAVNKLPSIDSKVAATAAAATF